MTTLTFNNIVVVPICSGVGLRPGANVGIFEIHPYGDLESVLSKATVTPADARFGCLRAGLFGSRSELSNFDPNLSKKFVTPVKVSTGRLAA